MKIYPASLASWTRLRSKEGACPFTAVASHWSPLDVLLSYDFILTVIFSPPALLSCTSLFYGLSLVFVVLFYVFYTKPEDCAENKFFISINMILCIAVSIVSILPKVQVLFFFAIFFWHAKQGCKKDVTFIQPGIRTCKFVYYSYSS